MESQWSVYPLNKLPCLSTILGQSIAVLQDPPAISLHSLQDGRVTLSSPRLPLPVSESPLRLMNIWWFRDERNTPIISSIPDIFKRNEAIVCYPVSSENYR